VLFFFMSYFLFFFFFFFQAEDGIRDRTVTGVQTWLFRSRLSHKHCRLDPAGNVYVTGASGILSSPSSNNYVTIKYSGAGVPLLRSEERRVGKEWRSRWAADR